MMPEAVLFELLARLAARNGGQVLVGGDELDSWPAAAVTALKSQKLLMRARHAAAVTCPGCECECSMPVATIRRDDGPAFSFVVCDKRSDINRVPVPNASLEQWRTDGAALVGFVSDLMGARRSAAKPREGALVLGMVTGRKRAQMIALRLQEREWWVVAGDRSWPLAGMFRFVDGTYSVDAESVANLADSTSAPDARYVPSVAKREAGKLRTEARHRAWTRAYRALSKQRPNRPDTWYAQQIAKMSVGAGRDAETIRKHMKA